MTQLTPEQAFYEAQRLLRMGDYPRAGSLTAQLVQNLPDEPVVRGLHGIVLARMGRMAGGLSIIQDALDKVGESRVRVYLCLEAARVLRRLNRPGEALETVEKGLETTPDSEELLAAKADALIDLGRLDEAKNFLASCAGEAAALAGPWGRVCLLTGDPDAGVERVAQAAKTVGLPAIELEEMLRLEGDLCEAAGRFEQAMAAWRRAARLRSKDFDAAAFHKTADALVSQWTAEALRKIVRPKIGGRRMVFLIGAPGAGQDLVEAVISSHPAAFGAGSLLTLSRVSRKHLGAESATPGHVVMRPASLKGKQLTDAAKVYAEEVDRICPAEATAVVDAQPMNVLLGGVAPLILPEARIVICEREPVDSALSWYASVPGPEHPYAHDLHDLGSFTADAVRLCHHWKSLAAAAGSHVHMVAYEKLVSQTRPTVEELLSFLELDFDEACLEPNKHMKLRLAPPDRLRLPISARKVGRHEPFAQGLKALRDGLGGG